MSLPSRSTVQGVFAFAAIVTGIAFIYWPAALIVAGLLLVVDLLT